MKALLLLFIVFSSIMMMCPHPYKYDEGTFSPTPVNLGSFNSEFDDYNSASPIISYSSPLCFSSNRYSKGGQFDIVFKVLETVFDRTNGQYTVDEITDQGASDIYYNYDLVNAISKANTDSDELGPYLVPMGLYYRDPVGYFRYIFFYSSNKSGDLDIKFTENVSTREFPEAMDLKYLNSGSDDAYPSLTKDSSAIYFCSNRGGDWDIYKADLVKDNGLINELKDSTAKTIVKINVLSSPQDDKCPFVAGNLMVFTSNRPGGYGGYDLYYSKFTNGSWSEPVNFGEKINTQYDEYRPIVKALIPGFTNDMMIFSSNRPGGVGGFDLYYVGIDKMTGLSWY